MATETTTRQKDDGPSAPAPPGRRPAVLRFLPLALLFAGGFLAWFVFDLKDYANFETLRENRERLLMLVAEHRLSAALSFVGLYALSTAFSLPIGSLLTVAGGCLFGVWLATGYVVVGATLGAVAVFLAARTALSGLLRARLKSGDSRLERMEQGFRKNALSYLLVLRLVPIFPFWLVNLVPAFLGVPLGIYTLGTFVGIIPGTLVYASVGNGLGALFEAGRVPDLGIIFDPEILLPILGLALLSLLPVFYRKWRAMRQGETEEP